MPKRRGRGAARGRQGGRKMLQRMPSSLPPELTWQAPESDVELRQTGITRILRAILSGAQDEQKRNAVKELRLALALELACYEHAQSRAEYASESDFKVLLQRIVAERAKRRTPSSASTTRNGSSSSRSSGSGRPEALPLTAIPVDVLVEMSSVKGITTPTASASKPLRGQGRGRGRGRGRGGGRGRSLSRSLAAAAPQYDPEDDGVEQQQHKPEQRQHQQRSSPPLLPPPQVPLPASDLEGFPRLRTGSSSGEYDLADDGDDGDGTIGPTSQQHVAQQQQQQQQQMQQLHQQHFACQPDFFLQPWAGVPVFAAPPPPPPRMQAFPQQQQQYNQHYRERAYTAGDIHAAWQQFEERPRGNSTDSRKRSSVEAAHLNLPQPKVPRPPSGASLNSSATFTEFMPEQQQFVLAPPHMAAVPPPLPTPPQQLYHQQQQQQQHPYEQHHF